ncbi:MAG: hypothetical protein ACR2IK_11925 [Chloroflexota bacterium]
MLERGGARLLRDRQWRATRGAFGWLPRDIAQGYAVYGDEAVRTSAFTVPTGSERFLAEAGAPAGHEPCVSPRAPHRHLDHLAQGRFFWGIGSAAPVPPDFEKLVAAGNRHNIKALGQFEALPVAVHGRLTHRATPPGGGSLKQTKPTSTRTADGWMIAQADLSRAHACALAQ